MLVAPAVTKVIISANDNPNGTITFRSGADGSMPVVVINEDTYRTAMFVVERQDGTFGTVSLKWSLSRVLGSGTPVSVSEDVGPVEGRVGL